MALQSIKYSRGELEILDQLLLPLESKYVKVTNTEEGWNIIHNMQIRGAPAIGVTAALSLAVELHGQGFTDVGELVTHVQRRLDYLVTSRPTAVNIRDSRDRLTHLVQTLSKDVNNSVEMIKEKIIQDAEKILAEDVVTNKTMGENGANALLKQFGNRKLTILTHCNTGSLATAGYGTALGVVRSLHSQGLLEHCYCTETRPYNQGSRLTAYELVHDKIPSTLICDDMAAMLMKTKSVDAVVLGADRIVSNGDTANKIGTYQLAVLAKYHNVAFYTVAPVTTIDLTMSDGSQIPIEERPAREVTSIKGMQIAAQGINVWNPAFDITPADLITGGIVTEVGVFQPHEMKTGILAAQKNDNKI